jgi:hypothetical protein
MKNKGYYSWIHSLNRAAIESQRRGFKTLKEYTDPSKDFTNQPDPENPGLAYDPTEHARIKAEIAAQGEERSNNRRSAAMKAKLGNASASLPAAANAKDLSPDNYDGPDAGSGGDANEVKAGKDIEQDELELGDFFTQARQAREILADIKEKEALRDRMAREEEDEISANFADEMTGAAHGPLSRGAGKHPYVPTKEQLPESLSQKINRILKG